MTITAYSFDAQLRPVDHGPVSEQQAIDEVNRRFAALKSHYDSGEEALAATMFGFSTPEREFIEICIHAHDHITFRHERPEQRKLWFLRLSTTRREESMLASRDELIKRVRDFFRALETSSHRQAADAGVANH